MISFTRSDPYTYAGVISGTGSLQQYKLSTLTLTGANTYTGKTLIDQGGTLIGDISKSANVTIAGTYDLNGTARTLIDPNGSGGTIQSSTKSADLTLISKNSLTFGGTINNTISSVTINGSGQLALVGNNTYTGTTTINSGVCLQIGEGGANGSIASTSIVNNGKIFFARSDPYTYAGVISGTGGLDQYNLNILTLTGANTYTGVTTIAEGGMLQIGSGSTTGNITSTSIVNSGKISFNRSDAYTYAGVISGAGSLTKSGSGTLTLTGAKTPIQVRQPLVPEHSLVIFQNLLMLLLPEPMI